MRFSSTFYQSILDNMSNPYTYNRIITDSSGQAVDFEYIQVNPAFERLLGKSNHDIIGHTVKQIEPNFARLNPDLLNLFSEVALWGTSKDFEYYCVSREKWFSISAYSPQPGFFVTIFNDVTAIKKVENDLRESEARWKYALEGAGDGVWDYDVISNKVFYSHQCKAMLGYSDEEISDSLYEWIHRLHPEDLLRMQMEISRLLSEGKDSFSSEYRLLGKDSNYKWILGRGAVVSRDAEGNPLRIIGTNSDITASKLAEETIKQQEENLLSFFNGIDSLLFVIDSTGEIKEANQTALETLGYTGEELRGQNIFNLQALDDGGEGAKFLKAIISGKKFNRTLTLVNKNRDACFSIDVRVVPGNWNGETVLFAACRDITELRLSEAKFFRAFHINPAIMSITTLDEGRYVDVNKSYCLSLEYERKEVLGHSSQELGIYYDITQREKFISIVRSEGRIRDFEIVLISKSGNQIIGLLSSDIIRIGNDNYLLTNVTNITERRLMEQELERKNLELEKLNKVLHKQASTDDLTGIYNHRFIFQRLREEVERAERYHQPLSIMMLDLDHFKTINDMFGHQTGDVVLHTVAQTIKQTLRNIDIPGRYGGEEFMVVLPQTSLEDSIQVAQRIREQVEQLVFDDERLKITISIGVATLGNETSNELLGRVDRMLYKAKDNGRNRVEY